MKDVRTFDVVVAITPNVCALVHNEDAIASRRMSFSDDTPAQSSADNEYVVPMQYCIQFADLLTHCVQFADLPTISLTIFEYCTHIDG